MPIRINESSVIERFDQIILDGAGLEEEYLRLVAAGVREHRPPVTMSVDSLGTDGFRSQKIRCLVVEPTERRLRHYRTAHYARPSGANLKVGWYLVGGEKAAGFRVGEFSIGGPSAFDVEQVTTIVQTVHQVAVLAAIHKLTAP